MMTLLIGGGAVMLLYSTDRQPSAWIISSLVIIGAGILLAFTRSMWVGTIAGALWLLWWKNKWLVVAVPLLIGILLLVNPLDVRERAFFGVHSAAKEGVLDSQAPISRFAPRGMGNDPGAPRHRSRARNKWARSSRIIFRPHLPHPFPIEWYKEHLHNIYIHFAAERGLPALAALLWLLGRALFDFWTTLRRLPAQSEARWVLHGAIAVIIGVMVSGWTELTLGHSQVLEMFLAVLACGYIAIEFPLRVHTLHKVNR